MKTKDLTERIRHLESELSGKDREIKMNFEEQRRLHESVRVEKDKYMHLEIQYKSLKMELDLLEKEKNNEINRLLKQFEGKDGASEKEMGYLIRKLEEQISKLQHESAEKDRKYHAVLADFEALQKKHHERPEPAGSKNDKNILEELLYRSREANESNNKALADSMNLIFVKMSELEKKSEETLKREVESLKAKTEANKNNKNEKDLLARVIELEKVQLPLSLDDRPRSAGEEQFGGGDHGDERPQGRARG